MDKQGHELGSGLPRNALTLREDHEIRRHRHRLEKHVVAIVDEAGKPLRKPTPFSEDDVGYQQLRGPTRRSERRVRRDGSHGALLAEPLRVSAHRGFAVVLLNPTRTARFAAEDLRRAKTDALDALRDRPLRPAETARGHCARGPSHAARASRAHAFA
ncbi:MAG: transposase [Sandaracinus sp.]|nr:transposase [Sandaracinus sp.]